MIVLNFAFFSINLWFWKSYQEIEISISSMSTIVTHNMMMYGILQMQEYSMLLPRCFFFVGNRLKYISVNFDKKRKKIEYSLKTAKLTNEMKNKKIPVWTVLRYKTQILGTGEQILSGNITLILITSLVYSNSSF
jgi:hypothetical protein